MRIPIQCHPLVVYLAWAETVLGIEPVRIRRRESPVGDSGKLGMCEDRFDQCLTEAKPARGRLDEDVAEMGTKSVVREQPAETDLRAVGGIDAEAQTVGPTALRQCAWPADGPIGASE